MSQVRPAWDLIKTSSVSVRPSRPLFTVSVLRS